MVHRPAIVASEHHLNTPGDYNITRDMVYNEVLIRLVLFLPGIADAHVMTAVLLP